MNNFFIILNAICLVNNTQNYNMIGKCVGKNRFLTSNIIIANSVYNIIKSNSIILTRRELKQEEP